MASTSSMEAYLEVVKEATSLFLQSTMVETLVQSKGPKNMISLDASFQGRLLWWYQLEMTNIFRQDYLQPDIR